MSLLGHGSLVLSDDWVFWCGCQPAALGVLVQQGWMLLPLVPWNPHPWLLKLCPGPPSSLSWGGRMVVIWTCGLTSSALLGAMDGRVSRVIHNLPLAFWGWYYWSLSPSFFKYVLWQKHTETLIFSVPLSHTHPHTLPVLSFWCCASFGCALLQKQQLETRSFLSFFSPPALIDDLEWSVNLTLIERKEKKKKNIQLLPYFPPQQIDQVSLQITSPHIYSSCCHSIIPNMTSMWNC